MTNNAPLSPQVFYVLLSLYQKDRHGYEIMKQIEADTEGTLKLGPGTLYGIIKRLLADELIQETEDREASATADERRKYYTLTPKGRSVLGAETQRLNQAVRKAAEFGLDLQLAWVQWLG